MSLFETEVDKYAAFRMFSSSADTIAGVCLCHVDFLHILFLHFYPIVQHIGTIPSSVCLSVHLSVCDNVHCG